VTARRYDVDDLRAGRVPGLRRAARPVRVLPFSWSDTPAGGLRVTLPLRAQSEKNAHEHWRAKHTRVARQRATTKACLRAAFRATPALPVVVTLTRIAPCALDDDNVTMSLSGPRDEIAVWLGLASDRDPRVTWVYRQERAGVREYGVRVEIRAREEG
jgi:hypothetical protein